MKHNIPFILGICVLFVGFLFFVNQGNNITGFAGTNITGKFVSIPSIPEEQPAVSFIHLSKDYAKRRGIGSGLPFTVVASAKGYSPYIKVNKCATDTAHSLLSPTPAAAPTTCAVIQTVQIVKVCEPLCSSRETCDYLCTQNKKYTLNTGSYTPLTYYELVVLDGSGKQTSALFKVI